MYIAAEWPPRRREDSTHGVRHRAFLVRRNGISIWNLLLIAALTTTVAALVANLLVPLVGRWAESGQHLDFPSDRKRHADPTPRLGGVAIVLGLLFGVGAVMLLMGQRMEVPLTRRNLVSLALGTCLVFLVGVVDDLVGVSALKKLAVEVLAASLVLYGGWSFDILGLPGVEIPLGPFSGVLTVLWIVGVTNAINLIDGLDGLAAGVVAIIGMSFLSFALSYQSPFAVALTGGIVGACIGFLPHNWEPARIFMGDSGSLTLGFLLGSLSVFTALKSPAAVAILVPLLALGVPVIDTLLVMMLRFLERPKGEFFRRFLRVFHADRNHLHHLLETLVTSRRKVVRWIYGMVVLSCLMAASVALTKRSGLGLLLFIVELVALVVVRYLGFARKAEQLTRRRRRDMAAELPAATGTVDTETSVGPQQ